MNKSKSNRLSPEVRERAVRMVLEHRGEYPSLWAVIASIAPKIGCVPQTLHEWMRRHEVDTGLHAGVTSEERDRIKATDFVLDALEQALYARQPDSENALIHQANMSPSATPSVWPRLA